MEVEDPGRVDHLHKSEVEEVGDTVLELEVPLLLQEMECAWTPEIEGKVSLSSCLDTQIKVHSTYQFPSLLGNKI
jgi:hypothetical protein